ncbi:protein of unknown function [Methylocaldum szegediense]|uniref:Transposase n=1 Tax=Methylocaldum szegediense TaxID=73780 RepID=A0ABM9I507_9GAMM|nr:protein of unknown function [Methylocaldum szegediense]
MAAAGRNRTADKDSASAGLVFPEQQCRLLQRKGRWRSEVQCEGLALVTARHRAIVEGAGIEPCLSGSALARRMSIAGRHTARTGSA